MALTKKLICVWGRNGCGKTTLAVNFAAWLAQKVVGDSCPIVGLVSAEDYSEIPTYLNIPFPPNKGYEAAKEAPTEDVKNFFVEAKANSGLYLLTQNPNANSFDVDVLDKSTGRKIIMESMETFDIVVVDCTTSKLNAITGEAIAFADAIVIPVDDNVTYPEWFHSNSAIFEKVKPKLFFVESKFNGAANMQQIFKEMNANPVSTIQYIQKAPALMNEGSFLFRGGREQKMYEKGLRSLWEAIASGR